MKTRRNIYYNLEESPYISKFKDFKFVFSSNFYRIKFEESLSNYIREESAKLKKRYSVEIDFEDILAFNLYRKIEKRGCYCIYSNNELNTFVIKNKMNCIIQVRK